MHQPQSHRYRSVGERRPRSTPAAPEPEPGARAGMPRYLAAEQAPSAQPAAAERPGRRLGGRSRDGAIQAAGLQVSPEGPEHLPGHRGGVEMPQDVGAKMEAAFGVKFSPVRIHEGPHVEAIGALAYTQGADIHFAPGQYQPTSQRGQELLGHELTHVVQQSQGRVQATTQAKGVDINDDASLERAADEMGARAARGEQSRESLHSQQTRLDAAKTPVVRRAQPSVQCDTGPSEAAPVFPPGRSGDAQTFDGFSAWAEASIADADDACVAAMEMSNGLPSPYQQRLHMLINDVVQARNIVDFGMAALAAGNPAPALTANPTESLQELDEKTALLEDVTEAWQGVLSSGAFELVARIGEARVARANALQVEFKACLTELQGWEKSARGEEMRGAFAQTGISAAISVATAAITFANPIVGIAVGIGATAVQLTLDQYLGPGKLDWSSWVEAGISTAGTALQNLGRSRAALETAGKRLGILGSIVGFIQDVRESRDAILKYERAAAEIRALATRVERMARELDTLRPLLEHPILARGIITTLQNHGETLRENGQLVLTQTGQL